MTLTSPNKGYPLEKLEGDSAAIADLHDTITRVKEGLDTLSENSKTVENLPGEGESMSDVREDATDLKSAVELDIDDAKLLAGVIQRYSDAYDTHAERANAMVPDIEDAHAEWERLRAEADDAFHALRIANQGDDEAAKDTAQQEASDKADERDLAKRNLDDLWEEYEGYYGDWDEAYDEALIDLVLDTLPKGRVSIDTSRTTSRSVVTLPVLRDLLRADTPDAVKQIWNGDAVSDAQRTGLRVAYPEIIGNLDGIPFDDRAKANRAHLQNVLDSGDFDKEASKRLKDLAKEVGTGNPPAKLVSFDADGSGQFTAAVAYGDLDTESKINVLVPGMGSHVGQMPEWGKTARDINKGVPGSATVTWFGYDSPDAFEEPSLDRARDGGASLSGFLDGLNTRNSSSETNVIAHSYGSTTAAIAIGSEPGGHGVDKFITVGSAGLPDDETLLKNLESGPKIYSTMSPGDPVAPFGQIWTTDHNTSPMDLAGTTPFGSDGGFDAKGDELAPTSGHSSTDEDGYLTPGTESQYNIKQIIATGEPGTEMFVPNAKPPRITPMQPDYVAE